MTPVASFDSRTNETLGTTQKGGLTDGHDFDSSTDFVTDRRGAELATQQELGLLPFRTARSDPASGYHTCAHWTALEEQGIAGPQLGGLAAFVQGQLSGRVEDEDLLRSSHTPISEPLRKRRDGSQATSVLFDHD